METKHTPGPWTISDCFNVPVGPGDTPEKAPSVWLNRRHDGLELGFTASEPRERILADARLIAAAPDLLAALGEVVGIMVYYHKGELPGHADACENPDNCGHCLAMRDARAAIRKATEDDR